MHVSAQDGAFSAWRFRCRRDAVMAIGRVLLVSRDAWVLEMVATVLRTEGYGVLGTEDAGDARAVQTLVGPFAPEVIVAVLDLGDAIPPALPHVRRSLRIPLLVVSPAPRAGDDVDAWIAFPLSVPELLASIDRLRATPGRVLIGRVERRSLLRPRRGDTRPCSRCGFVMRFEEPKGAPPAWMCRNGSCLHAEFVRAES
jgi:hypothetical protein